MSTSDDELRARVFRELDAAMDRLSAADPSVSAQRTLVIGMAYFADVMSRHFGHTVTTGMLITMAEYGFDLAMAETEATRN